MTGKISIPPPFRLILWPLQCHFAEVEIGFRFFMTFNLNVKCPLRLFQYQLSESNPFERIWKCWFLTPAPFLTAAGSYPLA